MLRKVLKKRLPSSGRILEAIPTQFLGKRINDPVLWHLTRRTVSRAAAIGMFCAYLPIPGEMLPAAVLAIIFRANLPISVLLVWISNPFTWLLVYTPPYLLGSALMGEMQISIESITVYSILQQYSALWLGCLIFGISLAAGAYIAVIIVWRMYVANQWQQRIIKRSSKKEEYYR